MSEHHTAICLTCQERKPKIDFPQHTNKKLMPDGSYMTYNTKRRSCFSCQSKKQKDADLKRLGSEESLREYASEKSRKCMFKKFGLTLEEGYAKLKEQNSQCKICDRTISLDRSAQRNEKAVLDHCHLTGKFRGFLCHKCNVAIGHLGDSPELVKKALDYLSSHIIVP